MQSPRRRRAAFTTLFAAVTAATIAAVALFNFLIDPYAVFGSRVIPGVNELKARPDAMVPEIKQLVGMRFKPNGLILGNSRAEIGLDPQSAALQSTGLHTFNAAVPGSDMAYIVSGFSAFTRRNDVRTAVVGLDFVDFLHRADEPLAAPSINHAWLDPSARTRLLALFSVTALADSLATIRIQRQRDPATIRSDGFNPLFDYRSLARSDGYAVLFQQRAGETARALARQPHNLHVGDTGTSPSLEGLRTVLRVAKERRIDLYLVIYPYHLLLQMQLQEAGFLPLFEQWKTEVTAIVDEARQQGTRVALWDFGCPSDYTAEAIPLPGDHSTAMLFYWEGGHFKKELGDVVLARMFTPERTTAAKAFGEILSPATIAARNAACQAALQAQRQRFPALAEQAHDLSAANTTAR